MSDYQVKPKTYLSFEDQAKLTAKLSAISNQTHWTEYFFLKYGHFVASGVLALSGISMWHAGYVAWNIRKYSKGRVLTLLVSMGLCPAGGLIHEKKVTSPLWDSFRKENMWYYGVQAVAANQICLLVQTGFSLGYSFTAAQMSGIIPVENEFLSKKHRLNTLKYVATRLAPFKRRLIAVNVLSSAFLFCVGARSYMESSQLLAKVGRKTVSEKED